MCLYVKNQQPLIADKDIVVLKYLNNTINGIFTPYINKQVILGEYVYVCQPEALETFNWPEKNNVLRVIPFLKK